MKTVKVGLGPRTYKIHIASGILEELGRFLSLYTDVTKTTIITDKTVGRYYGDIVAESLRSYKLEVGTVSIEPGEGRKSLATAETLYGELLEHGIDRKGLIVSLGGGVVGDIAGYVAATYMRGIPYVQVPTTLVAQVDSSIGGKVAVNHPRGKNLIGCFYQPRAVFVDPNTLKTLPREELCEGLVEVIKYGMIRDASFFRYLEDTIENILHLESEVLEKVLTTCSKIKAWVVHRDEREETGLRSILNYGHTFGHALEALGGYTGYRHGQAVALGMILATKIAMKMGLVKEEVLERQQRLLKRIGAPTEYSPQGAELDFLYRDKKALGGRLRFVLPVKVGKVIVVEVPEDIIKEVFLGG